MYGRNTGKLEVLVAGGAVWSKTGNQGSGWHKATVHLDAFVGKNVKMAFKGTRGNGFAGDIAIDDVTLNEGSSKSQPTAAPTMAPTTMAPTPAPTMAPTAAPTTTPAPTMAPTMGPTMAPATPPPTPAPGPSDNPTAPPVPPDQPTTPLPVPPMPGNTAAAIEKLNKQMASIQSMLKKIMAAFGI